MTAEAQKLADAVYTRRMAKAKTRQYSRDFTPRSDRRCRLTIDKIPPTLYDLVKAKAKRDGVSLRSLVLGWLKKWTGESE